MTSEARGRPPQRGERKEVASVRLTPTVREYLDAQAGSMSETIETLVRRTRDFRKWLAARKG